MNKYRVKNCPAISFAGGCQNGKVKVWDCQDCTDCLLKQIVEKCKNVIKCDNCELNGKQECIFANCTGYYVDSFAKELLQLLQIREVE